MFRSARFLSGAIAVLALALASCDSRRKAESAPHERVCMLPGGATSVASQTELQDICGCGKVEGDLTIDASAVGDLQCLRSLREVDGTLEISALAGASKLTHLNGLENLERVRSLSLARLGLTDLKALSKLEAAGDLSLIGLDGIRDLRGLERVAWTHLTAEKNPALRSLDGLKIPKTVGRVVLTDDPKLESLQPFAGVHAAESVALTQLAALTSLEGLGGTIDHFELTQCDGLTDLRGLAADIREFWLAKNAHLQSLAGFAGLQASADAASGSSLRVESQPELENLDGLFRSDQPRLDRVQLQGLPKVHVVDFRSASELHLLVVRSCTGLREIRGLDAIEAIDQWHLSGLPALPSLPAVPKLKRIVEIELIELPALKSLEPLSGVTSVDRIALNYLDALPSLRGLKGIATGQRILLEDLYALKSLDGLDGLQTVDQLWISNADKLTSLKGLRLQEARELAVRYNDVLKSLDGLETLRKVGTLDVSENASLTSLRGLSNLHEADKLFSRLNGKLPECELDRLLKQLPENTTHMFADNGPPGSCAP
jgi:Receptor L domain